MFSRLITHQNTSLYSNETFYKMFVKDLHFAKQTVVIESPFITSRRFYELLPLLTKLRNRNVDVCINTRNPIEHEAPYDDQALEAVAEMQEIGIKVLYTAKLHRKIAVIDRAILWEGSLNILSQNDSCEIMRRIISRHVASDMLHFIALPNKAC